VSMRHANDTVSHVTSSSAAEDGYSAFHVLGEDLRLRFDWWDGTLTGTVDGESIDYESDASSMMAEDRAFLRAVRESDPDLPRSPYADAALSLELTLAVNETVESGDPVDLA